MATQTVKINRAPVITLWAMVVAERLGHPHAEALTLAKAVAGLNAQSKGRRLGIYEKPNPDESSSDEKQSPKGQPAQTIVELMNRHIPVVKTQDGLRAVLKDEPIEPASVERYLHGKFGEHYADVKAAMTELAEAFKPDELRRKAYGLYEDFRPEIPEGVKGWGAAGTLDLKKVRTLAEPAA